MYKATIRVTGRPSILDPQGKAIQHALSDLGFASVEEVRMGKYVEVWIDEQDEAEAERVARSACDKLIANPVMETYSIEMEPVAAADAKD